MIAEQEATGLNRGPAAEPLSPAPTAKEAMEEMSGVQLEAIRAKSKVDLFFLAKAILGYDQITFATHAALCRFISDEEANRRMVLMPRGFLKSTICTISDSIRLAIAQPDTMRILIANEVEDNAIGFLKEIKGHWVGNGLLPLIFPELVPVRIAGPGADWSQTSASVNRNAVSKESTWTALGVGGTKVSAHYTKIKCDDLVGQKAKDSSAVMTATSNWTKDLTGLLDRLSDTIDLYGTRKAVGDTYEVLQQRWRSVISVFLREPFDENGESIFPKMSTNDLLQIMVDTPDTWAYDYMNNPVGQGGTDWGQGLLQYFILVDTPRGRIVRFNDPLTGKPKSWSLNELDIVITCDPNSGKPMAPDKAALNVQGLSPDDETFVLSSRSGRWSPDGYVNEIWADAEKWHPRVIGIEEAGQQNTIYYFKKKCKEERMFYNVEPLKHKNVPKEQRIRTGLDTPLKTKRFYVMRSQIALITQVQLHPQLAEHNWDEIDAVANGPKLFRKGQRQSDLEAAEDAEKKILAVRGVTGYGNTTSRRVLS